MKSIAEGSVQRGLLYDSSSLFVGMCRASFRDVVGSVPLVSREHSLNSWSCRRNELEDEVLDRGDMELNAKNQKSLQTSL